jgi:hypothetical protein
MEHCSRFTKESKIVSKKRLRNIHSEAWGYGYFFLIDTLKHEVFQIKVIVTEWTIGNSQANILGRPMIFGKLLGRAWYCGTAKASKPYQINNFLESGSGSKFQCRRCATKVMSRDVRLKRECWSVNFDGLRGHSGSYFYHPGRSLSLLGGVRVCRWLERSGASKVSLDRLEEHSHRCINIMVWRNFATSVSLRGFHLHAWKIFVEFRCT